MPQAYITEGILAAIPAILGWSIFWTLLYYGILKCTGGLRENEAVEMLGLTNANIFTGIDPAFYKKI